jgi:hypothetical protein
MGTICLEIQRIRGDVATKHLPKHINDVEFVLEDQKPTCIFIFHFEQMDTVSKKLGAYRR